MVGTSELIFEIFMYGIFLSLIIPWLMVVGAPFVFVLGSLLGLFEISRRELLKKVAHNAFTRGPLSGSIHQRGNERRLRRLRPATHQR